MIKMINNIVLLLTSILFIILLYYLNNIKNYNNINYIYVIAVFIILEIIIVKLNIELIKCKKIYSNDTLYRVNEIENVDAELLPVYLGYFFISLSLNNLISLLMVFSMIFIFIMLVKVQYYNPLFLCFGYHFYKIITEDGVRVFLISKRKIRINETLNFTNLARINNFVYFDRED